MASVMSEESEKCRLTGGGYYDEELGQRQVTYDSPSIEDWKRDVRHGFIRKVYGILAFQFAVTFLFTLLVLMIPALNEWVIEHRLALLISSCVGVVVTTIVTMCFSHGLRRFPWNYCFLGVFVLSMTLLVASAVASSDARTVLLALGGTLIITGGLTLFAMQTKYDLTSWTSGIFVATLVLMCFGLFAIFMGTWAKTLYATLAIAIFSVWLIIDTQLILGGKRTFAYTEDDYIIASISLYGDIINIFLELHYLLSRS